MACSVQLEPAEVLGVLQRHILVDGFPFVLDLEGSRGSFLRDACTGRRYLDFYTSFASLPLGYNHPALRGAEIESRLSLASRHKIANSDCYTELMGEWVSAFSGLALPKVLQKLFLIEGGTLAVENAIKAAFHWKSQHNRSKGVRAEHLQIIHFQEAFHGRSGYALSLTNTHSTCVFEDFPIFQWPRILNPKLEFPITDQNLQRTLEKERLAIDQICQALAANPHGIAALIFEPIQGEGGDHHFRPEFLQTLRDMADEHGFLLIADEVQTGLGATGTWWAVEQMGLLPDLLVFGKKAQVCGFASGARLEEVDSVFKTSGRINSTWGGNLVDMVRSQAILETIVKEQLLENARSLGDRLLNGLKRLEDRYPDVLCGSRGRGLLCALDCQSEAQRKRVLDGVFEKGLILLPAGRKGIRFRPHLAVRASEIDQGLEVLDETLQRLNGSI